MNYRTLRNRTAPLLVLTTLVVLAVSPGLSAQGARPATAPAAAPAPADPPPTPEAVSPIDLTGYWVSVVTEDWRYRMMVADKNDSASVPLNPEGRKATDMWDPAKDISRGEQCKSFGAGGIMRVPGRVHITWEKQTRLFHFNGDPPAGTAPTWQGYSVANWEGMAPRGPGGAGPAPKEGYLKVMTTNVRAGYLRTNGVPYSSKATVEEYFDSFKEHNGDVWLVVTTIVTDPTYLVRPFIVSTHFKKIPDASGWSPTECRANEPR
jgi:hypothetical protein